MRLKNYFWASAAMISLSLMAISCTEDNVADSDNDNGSDVEGSTDLGDFTNNDVVVWEADKVVELKDHFTVPEGKTLVIKEGVQVIATGKVGMNELPIEFTVRVIFIVKVQLRNLFFSLFLKMKELKVIFSKESGEVLLPLQLVRKCLSTILL